MSDEIKPTRAGQTVTIPDGYLTQEDVVNLEMGEPSESAFPEPDESELSDEHIAYRRWQRSLASRIAALLPPEKP